MKFIYNKLEAQAAEDYVDANNFYLGSPYNIEKVLYKAFRRVKEKPLTTSISSGGVTFLFDTTVDTTYVTILVNPSFDEEDEFVEVEV